MTNHEWCVVGITMTPLASVQLLILTTMTPHSLSLFEKRHFLPFLSRDDMESRSHPAEDLHHIYQLIGRAYRKQKNQVDTVVTNLDYDFIYLKLSNTVPSLGEFIRHVDEFMTL